MEARKQIIQFNQMVLLILRGCLYLRVIVDPIVVFKWMVQDGAGAGMTLIVSQIALLETDQ